MRCILVGRACFRVRRVKKRVGFLGRNVVVGSEWTVNLKVSFKGIDCNTFEAKVDTTVNLVSQSFDGCRKKATEWVTKKLDLQMLNPDFIVDIPVELEEREEKVRGKLVKVTDKVAYSKVDRKGREETFAVWRVIE